MTTVARLSLLSGMWLITRLRLQRLLNLTIAVYNRPMGSKSRQATTGKKRSRWLVGGFVTVCMLFSFGNLDRQAILNLHAALDSPAVTAVSSHHRVAHFYGTLEAGEFSDALSRGLTMEVSLLFCVTFLMSLGNRELARPDWDLEWLATLPVSLPTLLWARIVERSVTNPVGIIALWPACSLIAWYSDYRWSAPLVAAGVVLPLLFLAALARTLVDTGLRLSLTPPRLRNLQALTSIISVLFLYFSMSIGMRAQLGPAYDLARNFPGWTAWIPSGLAVRALNAPDPSEAWMLALLLVIQAVLVLYVGVKLLEYQLRNGVVAASSRESTRNLIPRDNRVHLNPFLAFVTVVQRRELRLLSRDRNFLVQSLLLPAIIFGSQLYLNGRLSNIASLTANEATMAAIAFGVAAYTLMLSAFQTLNSEGGALWMLYTVPRSIESILREKAQLWAVLALIWPLVVFATGIVLTHRVDLQLVGLAAIVLLGVPIYAAIAVSLGVFGCDPLAQEVQTRVRPTYIYLYLMLSGLYSYAIFASQWWQKLVLIVLTALLALALWQKARDELPYLLDPTASPPARVSTSDGMIAAMMFFVFQGLMAAIFARGGHELTGLQLVVVFSVAGAVTFGLVRYTYWRSGTKGVPSIALPRADIPATLGWGFAGGAVAALGGLVYLYVLRHMGLAPEVMQHPMSDLERSAWFLVLAVIAAPLFEEFIFRGLIFGGLRRSMRPALAIVASAAVFAIVHPPMSMIPVLGLGMCAAYSYERTRSLLAPMVTHALYNGVVLGYQLL